MGLKVGLLDFAPLALFGVVLFAVLAANLFVALYVRGAPIGGVKPGGLGVNHFLFLC
jgi:hypothetical protein